MLPNEMKSVILSSTKKSYFNSSKLKSYRDSKKSDSKKITKAMLYDLLRTMSDDDNSISNNKSINKSSNETLVKNDNF